MTRFLRVTRVGLCEACGRRVPGRLKEGSGRECQGCCPRCGVRPLRLNNIGPYTGNVGAMSYQQAIDFIQSLEYDDEVETCFRLEMIRPNGPRDGVLKAGVDHYHYLTQSTGLPPAKRYTLNELKAAWRVELADPEKRRMYMGLIDASIKAPERIIPSWRGQRGRQVGQKPIS